MMSFLQLRSVDFVRPQPLDFLDRYAHWAAKLLHLECLTGRWMDLDFPKGHQEWSGTGDKALEVRDHR